MGVERVYVNYELRLEEYLDAATGGSARLSPKFFLTLFFLASAMCFTIMKYEGTKLSDGMSVELFALITGVVFSLEMFLLSLLMDKVLFPLLRPSLERRFTEQFERLGIGDKLSAYTFQEEKWAQIILGQTKEMKWSLIRRWKDREHFFVLYLGIPSIHIPKRVCTEEQEAALRDLLHRKVGPPRVYLF